MARIRSLSKSARSISPHKTDVDATFQAVLTPSGVDLFHLSTYGSDHRASEAKVSQTFQIDKPMAAALITELVGIFGPSVLPA